MSISITCKDGLTDFFSWTIRENLVVVVDVEGHLLEVRDLSGDAVGQLVLAPWLLADARLMAADLAEMRRQRKEQA